MQPTNMVKVQLGYAYGGKLTGYKYNQPMQPKLETNFNDISPVLLTGFLRYLFVKRAKVESETIKYYMSMYSIKELWILDKKQYNELVFFLTSNQKFYSVWYKQFREYAK